MARKYELGFTEEGAGVPVVCLHSGGLSSRQWKRLAAVLAPTHRVILPDLIGYGATGTWPDREPFHFQLDVDAIVALVRTLDQPAHMVGHSYGGFLAMHVARAVPVRSLALYEPVTFSVLDPVRDAAALAALDIKPTWEPDASGVDEGWFTSFVDWWNGPGAWAAMPAETAAAFRAIGWKLFEEVRTLAADQTGAARFAEVTAPALILCGVQSPMSELRTVERLADALPAGRLQMFEGAGHMGPITHHAAVNAAIANHLRAS
ncbi:MAG TPA: alpha/beta hydrolase [Kofleriaceae bacterium]|nr:alpha/beta hydrolase [Kofleriaceae bacterium]